MLKKSKMLQEFVNDDARSVRDLAEKGSSGKEERRHSRLLNKKHSSKGCGGAALNSELLYNLEDEISVTNLD